LGFGALPTLVQAVGLQATPRSPDAAPAVVNATFNIGIAAGGVIGGRELLVASPATLAFTGAVAVFLALALLVTTRTRRPAPSAGAPAGSRRAQHADRSAEGVEHRV
jgi:predicted MFS family arabinose efflux permease